MTKNLFYIFIFLILGVSCKKEIQEKPLYDACINPERTDAQVGQQSRFSSCSSKDMNRFSWDFGDNSANVEGGNVIHTYKSKGTFNITLTAYSQDKTTSREEFTKIIIGNRVIETVIVERCPFTDSLGRQWDDLSQYPDIEFIAYKTNVDSNGCFKTPVRRKIKPIDLPQKWITNNNIIQMDTMEWVFELRHHSLNTLKVMHQWKVKLKEVYKSPIVLLKNNDYIVKVYYSLK